MQNWDKNSSSSDIHILSHTYRHIKSYIPDYNSLSWLLSLPVYNLMCEHHAQTRKAIANFVCLSSVTLPLSYRRSAWPFLLDSAPVLTALPAWSHPRSAWGLQNMGSGNQAEGFMLLMHQGLFCSVLLYKCGNSKQVLWAMFQPACLGLLIQAAIWLAALINQASGVDRSIFSQQAEP